MVKLSYVYGKITLKKVSSYLKMEQEFCIYCNAILYKLANSMVKCSSCEKKYSLLKLKRDFDVIDAFVDSYTAKECAKKLSLSYQVVFNRYETIRKLIIKHSHDYYEYKREHLDEFEEYMYICKSKKKDYSSIIDSQNFITFAYKTKVYTFLLPSFKRFHSGIEDIDSKIADGKKLKTFVINSHISKLKDKESTITEFWDFFEDFMIPYKGVKSEYFLSYLKEAEFKFVSGSRLGRLQ